MNSHHTVDNSATARLRFCALAVALIAAIAAPTALADDDKILEVAPDLRAVGWAVQDDIDGNNDGGLHPGETAYLRIYLSNRGGETARGVVGRLSEVTDHPDVIVEGKVATWSDVPATGTPVESNFSHFRIHAAATRPCDWEIPLRLEINAEDGYTTTQEFTLIMVNPQETRLDQGQARPFLYGADPGDNFGHTLATGDLDGDGYEDVVIAAIYANGPGNARIASGDVTVLYGRPGLRPDTDFAAPPPDSGVIHGADNNDELGRGLAIGDLNGDGYDDLFIGVYGGDGSGNARANSGEVAVVFGAATRITSIDLASPPSDVVMVYAADSNDYAGTALAAGDIDGNGFDDLILGVTVASGPSNGRALSGEVYVLYGGPTRWTSDIDLALLPPNTTVIFGAESDDFLGWSVAAGDLDGDGYDDVITSSAYADGPQGLRHHAGEVTIVYGTPTPPAQIDMASSPSGTTVIYGAKSQDQFGGIITTGDLNGDGHDEAILSAPQTGGPDGSRHRTGSVAIVYGGLGRVSSLDMATSPYGVAIVYGADGDDLLGGATAIGDLDGDGLDDLILGAANSDGFGNGAARTGEVAVIYGSRTRLDHIDLATRPPSVPLVYGASADDELGGSVAAADLDRNGYDELIMGAVTADSLGDTRSVAGEVAIIPGQSRSRYRWDRDDDGYAFIDATAGVNIELHCDDCAEEVPIGFEFDFYGRVVDTVKVSSNGYLTFGDVADFPIGHCAPLSTRPNDVIAVFWSDLNLETGGSVYYLLEGEPPFRRLTVEWHQVPAWPETGAATFEVTLFETSNQILFQYDDVLFGGPADNGATAVIGLENSTGRNGTRYSCFEPNVSGPTALRWRRFADPTQVFFEDFENGHGMWVEEGLWGTVSDPTCAPASRSESHSEYYGLSGTCDYDTGDLHFGSLTATGMELPQDPSLAFWHRRSTDGGPGTDLSWVEASNDPDTVWYFLNQVGEASGEWFYSDDFTSSDPGAGRFAPFDLAPWAGQIVDIAFWFDSTDANDNNHLGWMIDNVELRGCPVTGGGGGGGAAAEARATAQPDVYCETGSGRVDALGSYCTACGGLFYQWLEGGAPIPGANSVAYDLPPGKAPGEYGYSVLIECPTNPLCVAESGVAPVSIVKMPDEIGPTLMLGKADAGASVELHWNDVPGADDYGLFSDLDPAGPFALEVGYSPSGVPGIVTPMPADGLVFYLVAGRNPVCGVGDK